MSLQYFLDQQSQLQRVMEDKNGSPHPTDLFTDHAEAIDSDVEAAAAQRLITMMQWNNKALIHELVEMEAETGWKPWAKGAFVNIEAARGEWIDMLHFMLNGALLLGMDELDIKRRYDAKHKKNEDRQNAGYDGVTTKCLGCKRALDDAGVECVEYLPGTEFYEEQKTSFPTIDVAAFQVCEVKGGLFMRKAA